MSREYYTRSICVIAYATLSSLLRACASYLCSGRILGNDKIPLSLDQSRIRHEPNTSYDISCPNSTLFHATRRWSSQRIAVNHCPLPHCPWRGIQESLAARGPPRLSQILRPHSQKEPGRDVRTVGSPNIVLFPSTRRRTERMFRFKTANVYILNGSVGAAVGSCMWT